MIAAAACCAGNARRPITINSNAVSFFMTSFPLYMNFLAGTLCKRTLAVLFQIIH
jgi:hypothetical protein